MSDAPIQSDSAATAPDLWGDGEAADQVITRGSWEFALRGAEIADVAFAGQPILRGIRFIVRDHDWRTAENEVVGHHQAEDHLSIEVRSSFDGLTVLEWSAVLRWQSTTLRYGARARVLRPFHRNRIGLVVLHRPELAGTRLEVLHPNGATEGTIFPQQIAPHQPAQEVAGYRWGQRDVRSTLRLNGDVFEMEDQRNWTDASYKTYSPPLADPFPIAVEEGEQIHHELELTCAAPDHTADVFAARSNLIIPRAATLPVLQVGAATDGGSVDPDRIVEYPVLVEVPADEANWAAVLDRAAAETEGSLDVRIVAATSQQLRPIVHRLSEPKFSTRVARIGVYRRTTHLTDRELLNTIAALIEQAGIETETVAGTRAHFTELNRNIGLFENWGGGLSFSLTPQMHDRSRAQVVESIRIQRIVAEQAAQMASGRPVHVGPVSLRPRFNAVATTPFQPATETSVRTGYGPHEVPDASDPRQHSPALAAWTVATIAALSVPGIASITLFETWGQRGLRRAVDSPLGPGGAVIEWLRSGGNLITPPIELASPSPSIVGCLAQTSSAGLQIVIGNLGGDEICVRIQGTPRIRLESIGLRSAIVEKADTPSGRAAVLLRIPAFSTVRVRS